MALTEIIALLKTKSKIIYPVTQLKAITDDADSLTAPADADSVPLVDASDAGQMKKITWANIKTALSSVFAAKSHTHSAATQSTAGFLSATDKTKLDGIAEGANKYTHPAYTARTSGLYKITVDATGHVSAITAVSASDLASFGLTATVAELNYMDGVTSGVQAQLNTKAPTASPSLTGTPKAPTAAAGTNTTQIATTAFVTAAVNNVLAAANAMVFRGTIGSSGATVTALPASHHAGDVYVVKTAGTYAGETCEIGDMILCVSTGTAASDTDWTVVQTNLTGAVTGPTSAVTNRVVVFNGTTGKIIKDSGFTIGASVPAGAKFTDTTYSAATTSDAGLMSSADKTKLNGIATGANKYVHPTYTQRSSGLYKITVDATGHISAVTAVTKEDITELGIPAQDTNTTYSNMTGASASAAGKAGLVPAPAAGAATRYLRSDGTWQVPPNTTYSLASFGITATAAELNKLDGVTATAAEINKLDGLTPTTAELNYVDGVTSNIQTQLNNKAAKTAATQSAAGLMSAADKKKLDGLSGDEVPVYIQESEPSENCCIWIKPK